MLIDNKGISEMNGVDSFKINTFCLSGFLKIEDCELGERGNLTYSEVFGKVQYLMEDGV